MTATRQKTPIGLMAIGFFLFIILLVSVSAVKLGTSDTPSAIRLGGTTQAKCTTTTNTGNISGTGNPTELAYWLTNSTLTSTPNILFRNGYVQAICEDTSCGILNQNNYTLREVDLTDGGITIAAVNSTTTNSMVTNVYESEDGTLNFVRPYPFLGGTGKLLLTDFYSLDTGVANITSSGYFNSSGSPGISGTFRYTNLTNGTCRQIFSQGLLMSAVGCG